MADEVTLTAKLSVSNGNYADSAAQNRNTVDQANIGGIHGVQNIGTTYEAIALGEVSTEGYAFFRNLDTTNFVQLGIDGGASLTPFIRLNAGETALFRIDAGATLYALADTAAVDLEVFILEA
jgi:hypothetical protein